MLVAKSSALMLEKRGENEGILEVFSHDVGHDGTDLLGAGQPREETACFHVFLLAQVLAPGSRPRSTVNA